MPRKKPLTSTTVVNDVIEVNSKAYGKHYRKPRGSKTPITINSAFQKSVDLNKVANPVAKAIKDAIDPFFRKSFKDGTLWFRLVGLFKKHLAQQSEVDFRILETFELFNHPRGNRKFQFDVVVNVLNEVIHIELSTATSFEDKYLVKKCRQTLIVIFLDAASQATTISEEIIYPIEKTAANSIVVKKDIMIHMSHKQLLQSRVPPGTRWVLIAVKCDPLRRKEETGLMKLCRIKIVKAHEVK